MEITPTFGALLSNMCIRHLTYTVLVATSIISVCTSEMLQAVLYILYPGNSLHFSFGAGGGNHALSIQLSVFA